MVRAALAFALFFAASASAAAAADGTAEYRREARGGLATLYRLELDGPRLVGDLSGDPVLLEREDGVWKGQLGRFFITNATAERRDERRVRGTITSAQVGYFRYELRSEENGGWEISGFARSVDPRDRDQDGRLDFTRFSGTLSADARTLTVVSERRDSESPVTLRLRSDDGSFYAGRRGRSLLDTTAGLSPRVLARDDPALYVLLYVLALNPPDLPPRSAPQQ